MFVSGPTGIERELPVALADLACEEADGVLGDRLARRRREIGAVETGLAVDVRRDRARAARAGARRPPRPAHPARPHSSSTRSAFTVVFSTRLVADDGRHADELDLGRGDREHERDRVVVAGVAVDEDRRRHQLFFFSQFSTSMASGSALWAPTFAAVYAPAMQARRRASSYGRSSSSADEQAGGERVAGPGPVPGDDHRRCRAGDLLAVLVEHRAVGAVGDGDELAALHHLVLELVDDEQVGLEIELPRGRRVEREERRLLGRRVARPRPTPRAGRERRPRPHGASPRRSRRGRPRSRSRPRQST